MPMLAAGVVWLAIPDYGGDLENFHAVVKVRDRNRQPLRTTLGDGDVFCDPVPLEESGDWTAKALIAFEDKRFFRHGGIDAIAVGRAALHNMVRGQVVSGASTLTTLVVNMTVASILDDLALDATEAEKPQLAEQLQVKALMLRNEIAGLMASMTPPKKKIITTPFTRK